MKLSYLQVDSAVMEVESPDGTNKRKIGMIGVLSASPSLYKPGAFGGATIQDPWECLAKYNAKLKDAGCDIVVPLCHLYEYQDERTCKEFDFPVVLSGHDHHRVDRVIEGSRLLKPGMDAHYAVILDFIWDSANSAATPNIMVDTVKVSDVEPDPGLAEEVRKAYAILDPLAKTELATVPEQFSPLTSLGPRERRVNMATWLCGQMQEALNLDCKDGDSTRHCDCVIIKGGNFRGERHYDSQKFSIEGLKSEMDDRECVHIFLTPGSVLEGGLRESFQVPGPGWFQFDDGVELDAEGLVVSIGGKPLNHDRLYRVGSFIDFDTEYGTPSIHEYFKGHKEGLPDPDAGIGCHALLLKLFSNDIWWRLWKLLDADGDGKITTEELKVLDMDGDGKLSKAELRTAIERVIGLSTFEGQDDLLDFVLEAGGDANKDGNITIDEMNAQYRRMSITDITSL